MNMSDFPFDMTTMPIPEIFYPFLEDTPFARCLMCDCDLLQPGVTYFIEKAFKGTEVIFELAICMNCCEKTRSELSPESQQRIQAHFQEKGDLWGRGMSLLKAHPQEVEPWLEHCLFTDTPRGDLDAYQIYGHCQGTELVLFMHPFMISDTAINQMGELLSKQTRDAMDDFVDEYLGMPPEFKELFDDAPLLLI